MQERRRGAINGYGDFSPSNAERINNDSLERVSRRNKNRAFGEWVRIVLFALFLSLLLFVLCAALFFRARVVEIDGCTLYTEDELLAVSGIGEHDNIFTVSAKDLQQRISLSHPYIRGVRLERVPPSTLIIHVTEDIPAWYTELEGQYFLLSDTLRVLEYTDNAQAYAEMGLRLVEFPAVTFAMVGRQLRFVRESTYAYMRDFLGEVKESDLFGILTRVDASDKYRISLLLEGGRIKAEMGDAEETAQKLALLGSVRERVLGEEQIALVDVSDLKSAYLSYREQFFE